MVSGHAESDVSDTDEEKGWSEGRDDKWLMTQLPRLPHFTAVLPRISHLLLQACLMETSLADLVTFVLFITSHAPHDLIFEFSIGISQIVVDRFAVIKRVFGAAGEGGRVGRVGRVGKRSQAEAMHGSLLSMLRFERLLQISSPLTHTHSHTHTHTLTHTHTHTPHRVSLEMALQSQRVPQVSGSSDFVLVTFPSGKKTILHTALIHASLLLLTVAPPPAPPSSRPASADFDFLSDLWLLPAGERFPQAHTVEEKEEVPLISPTILPEMFLSDNQRLVALCLREAQVSDIVASVRQFGVPEVTMEQILSHLDTLCGELAQEDEETPTELEKAVQSSVQLVQFAEVQFARCGSRKGRAFLSFVRNLGGIPDDDPANDTGTAPPHPPLAAAGKKEEEMEFESVPPTDRGEGEGSDLSSWLTEEKIEQVLLKMFTPSAGRSGPASDEVAKISLQIEKSLKKSIQSRLGDGGKEHGGLATPTSPEATPNLQATTPTSQAVVAALHKIVVKSSGRSRRQVLDGMTKSRFAISLLRLLTRIQTLGGGASDHVATETNLLRATVKQISDSLATMKLGKIKELPRFQAVVKACSVQLDVKTVPERDSISEKVKKVAEDCTAGIRGESSVFGTDRAEMIADICRFVGTEKKSHYVETVLSALVRHSVATGTERDCVDFFQRLSWRCRPIAVYHSPDSFSGVWLERESERQREEREKEGGKMQVSSTGSPFVRSLDMSGLKVDLLEVLDPELVGEVAKREVFGWSQLGEREDGGEGGRGWLGPGHLMARLVHESSWETLHGTVVAVLKDESCQDDG